MPTDEYDEILEDRIPSTRAPGLGKGRGRKRADGWTEYQLAIILGVTGPAFTRWRAGLRYPGVRMLKKIELVFGWPAREQIELIPLNGYDLSWSMKFNQVLNEWKAANPRTQSVDELKALYSVRSGRKKAEKTEDY